MANLSETPLNIVTMQEKGKAKIEGPYVTYDLLPFPNGLKYQAHGPLIVDELVVNLTFELVGPGEYRVVHPKNMQPNIAMSEYT